VDRGDVLGWRSDAGRGPAQVEAEDDLSDEPDGQRGDDRAADCCDPCSASIVDCRDRSCLGCS